MVVNNRGILAFDTKQKGKGLEFCVDGQKVKKSEGIGASTCIYGGLIDSSLCDVFELEFKSTHHKF